MAGKQVLRAAWIPSGQFDGRAVLKRMADRVKHIGLDPERVASLAGPDAQPGCGGDRLAGCPLSDDGAGRIRIDGVRTPDTAHDVALLALRVTLVEGNAVGQIFDRIAIEIDLEFVHAFGMVAGRRNGAEDRVADVDHEHGACLAAEYV